MEKSLIELRSKEEGVIRKITGGRGLRERLNALGIREKKKIVMVSGIRMGGPVVIKMDNMDIALGKGMASKVIVEVGR
ncbi:MAG: ferrous iron transport protein A [Spirochaetes bacterium]|nr:ferrous iron transport protein A [Spirochaetota bacterium]